MKQTMFALSALVVTSSICLFSTPVSAFSMASASLTDLSYRLTDLQFNDGITPNFEFDTDGETPVFSSLSVSSFNSATSINHEVNKNSSSLSSNLPSTFSPVSAFVGSGNNYAKASVDMHGLSAEGSVVGQGNVDYSSFRAHAEPGFFSRPFRISPQTSITFSGNISVAATSSHGAGDLPEFSSSTVQFSGVDNGFNQTFGGFTSLYSSNNGQSLENVYYQDNKNTSFNRTNSGNSFTTSFDTTFTNNNDSVVYGQMLIDVTATGSSIASNSPVPEPNTYAMLLGGLVLLGLNFLRRSMLTKHL